MDVEGTVRLAQAGDHEAVSLLYKYALRYAERIAPRIMRSRIEDAEDVAHMAAANAIMKLGKFYGNCQFKTWVHRIVVNQALMELRRKDSLLKAERLEMEKEDGYVGAIDVPVVDGEFARKDALRDLERILGLVSPLRRTCITMAHIDGYTGKEISELTGLHLTTVKDRIHRGMKEARTAMESPAQTSRQCVECERSGRFRFSDTVIDGTPLCNWCAKDKRAPIKRVMTDKNCAKCGSAFTPSSGAQKFCSSCRTSKPAIVSTKVVESTRTPSIAMVTVTIPVTILDSMWESLAPEQKARAFEFVMK